jgi:membrane-associated phospholipid phosphatase
VILIKLAMTIPIIISAAVLPLRAQDVIKSTVPFPAPANSSPLAEQAPSYHPQVSNSAHANSRLQIIAPSLVPEIPFSSSSQLRVPSPADESDENTFQNASKHFLMDQRAMWTSPARIRLPEATWLVPLGGLTAGLFATDTDVSRHLDNAPRSLNRYGDFSNYGVGVIAGAAGSLYFMGLATHNPHQRETGFLSGEAAVDTLVAVEALKYATGRERPVVDNANGSFRQGGDSFPSEHAAAAWSIASVIAHEYPGPLTKLGAYGFASAITAARITGKQHFPSDALVGAAIGWLVGYYVYKQHHDPDLGGGSWRLPAVRPDADSNWSPRFMGSPYVPLDSWVYPALLRLGALGFIKSDFEGMRPWTRMECARLVEEATENISDDSRAGADASRLESALRREFSGEIELLGGGNNAAAQLESVYTRVTDISGKPLTDGYHFGQTIVNDYGRPYQEGINNVTGVSGWGTDGPFVGYFRGEYQHAPSASPLPATALQAIAQEDRLPSIPPGGEIASSDQFQLLDAYVGMNFRNWQITFGRQSQWWGPDASGPMDFSNNAEPVDMLQINRISPFQLPSLLGILGPVRTDFFLGHLTGQHFILIGNSVTGSFSQELSPQPFLFGEKVSFKPTRNLEVGFGLTTVTGGPGDPFTAKKFFEAAFPLGGGDAGTPDYYGNGHSEMDFTYRVPWMRNWLTLYADGYNEDEPSPILGAWDKAAWTAGIYIPTMPKIPKLDFRAEGIYSDPPIGGTVSHGSFYIGTSYRDGYTNARNLIGSWIGRQGQGGEGWATYWFTPEDKLQFSFRHQKVSQQFVPFGGTLTDGSVRGDFWIRSEFSVTALVQYERWNFPILSAAQQTDVSASIQFAFWPKNIGRRRQKSAEGVDATVDESHRKKLRSEQQEE